MKTTEQFIPVVLFIILYKVVLTFGSVYEIQKSDFPTVLFVFRYIAN